MRPIKFRAWDKKEKTMHYSCPFSSHHGVNSSNGKLNRHDKHSVMTWDGHCYENGKVQDYILEQFTGLTDKNGSEIYEGDIVKAYHRYDEKYYVGIIDYKDMCYQLRRIKEEVWDTHFRYWKDGVNEWYSMEQYFSEDLVVIGNIHENKELLEVKDETN